MRILNKRDKTTNCPYQLISVGIIFFTGALYGQALMHCQFSSHDGHDAVYLEQYYFNKVLWGQYNSTVGKIIGYTKKAKEIADILNSDARFVNKEKWKTELCKRNTPMVYDGLLTAGDYHRT